MKHARALPLHWACLAAGCGLLPSAASVAAERSGAAPVTRAPALVEPYRFPMDFKHYYDYDDLSTTLERVAHAFPDLTELRSIGKSRDRRDLWMLRVTDERTGEADAKPAIYVDGNIHGNEIQATEVCLYVIYDLVNRFGRDGAITELLHKNTFYIVPTVNPDGRERFFRAANSPHSSRWNLRPFDEDLDGRVDEDGPDDVDGDGVITSMRKKDPFGPFREGTDPRILVQKEPDEPGAWTLYFEEGKDDDGDGLVNEDGPGGVDLNRNFPADWQPTAVQYGAGPYPGSEPEIRALLEFFVAHPNIAAAQSFHNNGNLILYPFGARSAQDLPNRDREVYAAIAERGREILLTYKPGNVRDDLYRVYGSMLDFAYIHRGVMAFTNELWDWILDYDKDGSISEAERLRWNDERLGGDAFVPWKPFDHPELGPVEIGGWTQFHTRAPPIGYLEDLCRLNSDFVLFHASTLPGLAITRTEVTPLPGGVVALDVFIANTGILDTAPQLHVDLGLATPVVALIETSDDVRVLEGSVRPRERALHAVTHEATDRRVRDPARVELGQIQGGTETAVRWLLSAGAGSWARVRASGEKAGSASSDRIPLRP